MVWVRLHIVNHFIYLSTVPVAPGGFTYSRAWCSVIDSEYSSSFCRSMIGHIKPIWQTKWLQLWTVYRLTFCQTVRHTGCQPTTVIGEVANSFGDRRFSNTSISRSDGLHVSGLFFSSLLSCLNWKYSNPISIHSMTTYIETHYLDFSPLAFSQCNMTSVFCSRLSGADRNNRQSPIEISQPTFQRQFHLYS